MGKDKKNFMPETFLQWCQAITLLIGIVAVLYNWGTSIHNKFLDYDRRLSLVEYKLKIKHEKQ